MSTFLWNWQKESKIVKENKTAKESYKKGQRNTT